MRQNNHDQSNAIRGKSREVILRRAACAALVLCAVWVWGMLIWQVWTVSPVSGNTNSDSVTELLYARHMARTGELLPGDWYFTTEVRLLHNSLVAAPLFLLTDDFLLVHTLTSAIVMALLYAVGLWFLRSAGLRWPHALAGALLMLCPASYISFEYYQDAMYYSFFLLCTLALWSLMNRACAKAPHARPAAAAGCVLAFAMGLCGIRYQEILFLPMAGVAGLRILQGGLRRRQSWRSQAVPLAVCAAGAAGYAAVKVLQAAGRFPVGALQSVGFTPVSGWPEKLRQTLHAYRMVYSADSPWTALVALCILGAYVWLLAHRKSLPARWRDYLLFVLLANLLNAAVLVAVDFGSTVQFRYALLPSTFGWLALPMVLQGLADGRSGRRGRAAGLAVNGLLAACVLLNTWHFVFHFPVQTDMAASRAQAIRYIEDAGWSFGYGTYWNANVTTGASNAAVTVAPVSIGADGALSPFPMGCPHSYFQEVPGQEPQFILLDARERQASGGSFGKPAYENEWFAVYPYNGPALLL